MKAIKYLFSILTVALVFSSCVDYSDASDAVTAKVQLQLPDELNGHMTLEGTYRFPPIEWCYLFCAD